MEQRLIDAFRKHLIPKIPAIILVFLVAFGLWMILDSEFIPLESQPFPDTQSYSSQARQIADGNGFVIDFDERISSAKNLVGAKDTYPSRYPPGYSIFLAPFVIVFGDSGIEVGVKVAVFAMFLVAILIAKRLSGFLAASIVALAIVSSPFLRKSSTLVMSDAFGALLCLLAVLTVIELTRREPGETKTRNLSISLGMICGFAMISRISLIFIFAAALLVFTKRGNLSWIVLGFVPFALFLGVLQHLQFGSPFRTGYSYYVHGYVEFSLSHLTQPNPYGERDFLFPDWSNGKLMTWTCPCDENGPIGKAPNIVFYPATLAGLYWIFMPPLFGVLGFIKLFITRTSLTYRFMAAVIALNTLMMFVYFFQGARLVAPSALILVICGSIASADLVLRIIRRTERRTTQDLPTRKTVRLTSGVQ
ncbi:MAG: hypothetical protein RL726_1135 [Actinomycetota bacterium]|jgi:4-amino-4-deoxy-L-arabinose transferase-like glycosyltransferase